jgi:hypothetical protein
MLLLLAAGEPTPSGGRQNLCSDLSNPFLRGLDGVHHGILLAAQADIELDPLRLSLVAG